ncbi:ABC transporter substrate-binding protein [Gulosibacter sp. 10]|uniref:ABC transporter substrate-binding protein n=1 Tax=Gulosibacter sp. 10 TaxID=1255570 RepID=UPI00097E8779|nr:ABC transporter substrate-binding protein [Gulosibacter sp. 10]SJM67520.1 ABC Fe(3+) transporter, substrate binding component [Gulosibacter sp. 10]
MTRMRTALASCGILALALTGCAAGSDDDAGTGEGEGLLGTVPDTLYGPVEVPEPEDGELTVVALGWSDAEVALALGVTPVGVSDWLGFGADASGVGPWAQEAVGDAEITVFEQPFGGYDYEAIQELEPDVILNTRSAADEEQFQRLDEIAPTVFAPEGTADFGTAWDVQVAQVAAALGLEEEGAAVIAEVEQEIEDVAAAHPEFEGITAVTGTKFGDAYGAYVAGDFRWDLMESLGFEQNPPVLDLEASGFYVELSAEQIGALDAEAAVFFPIGYTLDEMKADPLVGSLDVVQEDRTVWLEEGAELTQAFSAASPLSIPIVVSGLADQLSEIVG